MLVQHWSPAKKLSSYEVNLNEETKKKPSETLSWVLVANSKIKWTRKEGWIKFVIKEKYLICVSVVVAHRIKQKTV